MDSEGVASRQASGDSASLRRQSPGSQQDVRDKSTAELLGDLSTQLTALIRQEVDLAKAELSQKTKRLGVGAGFLGTAGLLTVFAFGALVAAAIAALQSILPLWAAALIVGVAILAVAAILALMGKSEARKGAPPVPEQALQSTKEDAAWLKTQTKSAKP